MAGRWNQRWLKVGLGLFLVLAAFTIATALVPTRLDPIAEAMPPFAATSGRKPASCPGALACEPPAEEPRSEEVSFASTFPERGLTELSATLWLPAGDGPHPAVVFVGGSGPNPRDPEMRGGLIVHHPPFKLYGALARWLAEQGFATLLYDKRTCRTCYPETSPDYAAFRFGWLEDDARDAIAYLRRRADVQPEDIVLMGHSQGGGIVARLAREESVSACVMLAGSTNAFADGIAAQIRRLAELRLAQLDPLQAIALQIRAASFEDCLAEAAKEPDVVQACLYGTTHRAFDEEATRARTTAAAIASLEIPFLAVVGQLDQNIDPQVILDLRDALGPRDAEVHVLEGLGHTLVHRDRVDAPTLEPALTKVLGDFLRSVPSRAP